MSRNQSGNGFMKRYVLSHGRNVENASAYVTICPISLPKVTFPSSADARLFWSVCKVVDISRQNYSCKIFKLSTVIVYSCLFYRLLFRLLLI